MSQQLSAQLRLLATVAQKLAEQLEEKAPSPSKIRFYDGWLTGLLHEAITHTDWPGWLSAEFGANVPVELRDAVAEIVIPPTQSPEIRQKIDELRRTRPYDGRHVALREVRGGYRFTGLRGICGCLSEDHRHMVLMVLQDLDNHWPIGMQILVELDSETVPEFGPIEPIDISRDKLS